MSSKIKKFIQKIRVPLGFVFAVVFMILASPSFMYLMIGVSVAFVGLLIRAWAAGHIRKNEDLAISGPYAFTRNPLYLGSFLLGLGFMIASGVWWLALIFVVLYLGIYFPVMSVEAEELSVIFGEKYNEYADEVSLFFPWFSKYKSDGKKFEKSLYIKHREYQAALGFMFVAGVLTAKAYFF
ncbi:MAG: isoprenylcysteine carboxylmethyltransferase family protein [Pyrinomonadaceae bacterium]|nr:isoprenylcysteine carboxylmethyltransferase family protein [Pyrinomonadaceae bacterium]